MQGVNNNKKCHHNSFTHTHTQRVIWAVKVLNVYFQPNNVYISRLLSIIGNEKGCFFFKKNERIILKVKPAALMINYLRRRKTQYCSKTIQNVYYKQMKQILE